MSKERKYVTGGGINPHWLCEREREKEKEIMRENICITMDTIHSKELEYSNSNYEAQFQFLKNHSNTPEDLELAKLILGIYD